MGKFREMFRPRAPVARQLQVVGLRKLYLVDLVSDAVNGPLGLGVFVLLGYVARSLAGPSVIVSITYAAIVAIIAGTFPLYSSGFGMQYKLLELRTVKIVTFAPVFLLSL